MNLSRRLRSRTSWRSVFGFSVSKEGKSRGAALHVVAAKLQAVIAAVQATPGIGTGDVTTGQISVRKISRDKHTLFRASEGVGVAGPYFNTGWR